MANDYTTDPYQLEEDTLNEKIKRATAMMLRQTPDPNNIVGNTNAAFDRVRGTVDLQDADRGRQALGAKYQAQLAEALRTADPEVQAMVMHPATRTQGLALWQKQQQMKLDQQEFDTMFGPGAGGSSGGMPTYEQAVKMSLSANPTWAARGKQLLETMKPQDPKNNMRLDVTGNLQSIPGGEPAYIRQQQAIESAKNPMVKVPDGKGGEMYVPRQQAVQMGVLPPEPALPNATGQTPPAAGGPPAAPAPPTYPSPAAPASAPIPPVSGGPTALPRASAATAGRPPDPTGNNWQVPPAVQQQRDQGRVGVLLNEYKNEYAAWQQTQDPTHARNLAALQIELKHAGVDPTKLDRSMPPVPQQQGALPNAASASAPPPQQPQGPTALPSASAASMPPGMAVNRPDVGVGRTDPVGTKMFEEGAKTNDDIMKAIVEKQASGGAILNKLNQIEQLNKAPTYAGGAAGMFNTADQFLGSFTGGSGPRQRNTDVLESQIQELVGPLLKQYGSTNPSNLDLTTAMKRVPSLSQDPRTRQDVINQLRKGIQAESEVNSQAMQIYNQARESGQYVNLPQITQYLWQQRNAAKDQQAPGNPTQPGGANALPGARAATGPDLPVTPRDAAGGVSDFTMDLLRNARDLPKNLASPSGWAAAKDTYSNMWEGGKELFGQGDREAAMKRLAAQEQREKTDPAYYQAKILHGIVNPVSLAGGVEMQGGKLAAIAAPTVMQIAKGATFQGLLHPAESYSNQIVQGLKSGAIGAATAGIASKFVPTTEVSQAINQGGEADALLAKFPSFKPTSNQVNPGTLESKVGLSTGANAQSALEQTKAITKDLMSQAGIKGEVLTPDAISAAMADAEKATTNIFKPGVKIKVDTTDVTNLQNAVNAVPRVQDAMAKAPTLGMIHTVLSSGKPERIAAPDLLRAWKEVGEIGATKEVQAEIKGVLKGLMVKAMPSADLAAFNSATERMALTQDINRIYRGGGSEGTGRAAGYLDPSKIVTEAGTGPRNSAVDDAARLIKKFQVENFAESKFTPSLGGVGKEIMNQGGKLIHQFDPVAVRADSITRRLADALRAGVRTPMNLYDPTRYAAPPGDNNAP